MTQEMKQDFTIRISAANKTGIVVLTYEIALEYLEEAKEAIEQEEFNTSIRRAKRCIEELRDALDFRYSIAFNLLRLYNYILKELDLGVLRYDKSHITICETIVTSLHDAFQKIEAMDESGALMQNTETVYSGLTYGKNGVNENIEGSNRGFKI